MSIKRHYDEARRDLAAIFDKVIQARRESGTSEPDVLQTFIDARYKVRDVRLHTAFLKSLYSSSVSSTLTATLSKKKKKKKKKPHL